MAAGLEVAEVEIEVAEVQLEVVAELEAAVVERVQARYPEVGLEQGNSRRAALQRHHLEQH